PALLPPAGRECGDHLYRLCVGAEPAAGWGERTGAPSPGEGAFLRPQGRPLRAQAAKGELSLLATFLRRYPPPQPAPARARKGGGRFSVRCLYARPLDGGGPGWGWDAGLLMLRSSCWR